MSGKPAPGSVSPSSASSQSIASCVDVSRTVPSATDDQEPAKPPCRRHRPTAHPSRTTRSDRRAGPGPQPQHLRRPSHRLLGQRGQASDALPRASGGEPVESQSPDRHWRSARGTPTPLPITRLDNPDPTGESPIADPAGSSTRSQPLRHPRRRAQRRQVGPAPEGTVSPKPAQSLLRRRSPATRQKYRRATSAPCAPTSAKIDWFWSPDKRRRPLTPTIIPRPAHHCAVTNDKALHHTTPNGTRSQGGRCLMARPRLPTSQRRLKR